MPDLWFYGILNFWKKGRVSSNLRKIRDIVLKLHTNMVYHIDQATLLLNLAKIDWSVQIFSDFELFENFLKII